MATHVTSIDSLIGFLWAPSMDARAMALALDPAATAVDGGGWRAGLSGGPFTSALVTVRRIAGTDVVQIALSLREPALPLDAVAASPDAWSATPFLPDSDRRDATRYWDGEDRSISCVLGIVGSELAPATPVRDAVCLITPM